MWRARLVDSMWLLVLPALVLVIGLVLANTSLERRVDPSHADPSLGGFRELRPK
ncbi:MAG TPA: hypothetical protein PKC19_01730 [Roseiflexaceae bacterium]|nr:hypothetical protein [Roseiflexaceae bacterium]